MNNNKLKNLNSEETALVSGGIVQHPICHQVIRDSEGNIKASSYVNTPDLTKITTNTLVFGYYLALSKITSEYKIFTQCGK